MAFKKVLRSIITFMLILCTNVLAAIVSDNDGSAFVTKAEFDALKTDFNSQIDSYNTSIDGKIDGAIASYLSGIKLSSTEAYKINYDNNWAWNSSTSGTYDSESNKKLWYTAKFFTRTRYDSAGVTSYYNNHGFAADYSYTPVKTKLFYETYEYKTNTSTWEPVKICFRVNGVLHFGRSGEQTNAGGTCGGVQWFNFWPDNAKEGVIVQKEMFSGAIFWYNGATVITVDYTDGYTKDVVLYPNSTTKTYYYLKDQIIMKDADKGAVVGDSTASHWVLEKNYSGWYNSTISNFTYYPNQLVSSDTNKATASNAIIIKEVKDKSSYNAESKYGVCVSVVSGKIDDKIAVEFVPKTDGEGKIKFAIGDSAESAWSTSNIYDTWEYDITPSDIGKGVRVTHTITKEKVDNKPLFFIYEPSNTGDYKIDINAVYSIKNQ